jgi:hypothetical protein
MRVCRALATSLYDGGACVYTAGRCVAGGGRRGGVGRVEATLTPIAARTSL